MAKAKIFPNQYDGANEEAVEWTKKEREKGIIAIMCPGCGCQHELYTKMPLSNGAKWSFNGDFDKPTFSPSLLIRTGKYVNPDFDDEGIPGLSVRCHSFIRDGRIQFLSDCTHALAGKTVELPEI